MMKNEVKKVCIYHRSGLKAGVFVDFFPTGQTQEMVDKTEYDQNIIQTFEVKKIEGNTIHQNVLFTSEFETIYFQ